MSTSGAPNEAEATIEAIHQGAVDALVVHGPKGPQIVMLHDGDRPYRMLVERMSDGALTLGPDNRILYANRQLADLTGEAAGSLIGREFSSLFEGGEPAGAENATVDATLRNKDKTLPVSVWSSSIHIGGVTAKLVTITDQSFRQQAQAAISAERFARSILEQSTEAILVLAPNGRITHASLVAEEIARRSPVGATFSEAFLSRDGSSGDSYVAGLSHDDLDIMLANKPFHGVELKLGGPEYGAGSFQLSAGPLLDDARNPIGAIVTLTDITARKRAEEQQTILVAELNHRVKNILAVVQAVAAQTIRASPSLPTFASTFAGRIKALSVAHDILTRTRWIGIGLNELLEGVLAPYRTSGHTRIRLNGPPVLLPARTVVPLSMALHELATNAMKYGALSSPRGMVDVEWGVRRQEADLIDLAWREQGGPQILGDKRTGFGTTLIQRVVNHDLEGTAELDFAEHGLVGRLKFPLSRHAELMDLSGGAQV